MRRSFNSMLMSEDSQESLEAADQEARGELGTGEVVETEEPAWDREGNRPRILLQYDTSAELRQMMMLAPPPPGDPMGIPQRLEIVLPRSPIPPSLRLPTRGWLAQGVDLESDREVYGISGAVRGVFELRPDGSRERYLLSMGMTPSSGERVVHDEDPDRRGWTLWWRPVFPDEIARQQAGMPETSDDFLRAAAEAYPIIRGIRTCRILAFDNAFRKPVYAARTATDLPAFVEVEIECWSGLYANWMFEVGWLNGPDPTIAEPDAEGAGDAEVPDGDGAGNGAGNGAGGAGSGAGGAGGGGTSRRSLQSDSLRRGAPGGRPQTGRPGGGD
jgi:hypothetical protein